MIFEEIYKLIRKKIPEKNQETLLIGIYGMPGAGKSEFSKEFARYLEGKRLTVIHWNCDIYTKKSREQRDEVMKNVRALKSIGQKDLEWPLKAYGAHIDIAAEHMKKMKNRENFFAEGLCNHATKKLNLRLGVTFREKNLEIVYDESVSLYDNQKVCFLIDWAFLGCKQLREKFDFLIFLKADFDTRLQRAKNRGLNLLKPIQVDEELFRDVDIYQGENFEINERYADVIIDNVDFNNRKMQRNE